MWLIDRAKNILLQPKQEWVVISGESKAVLDLYRDYIVILAAIGPVAGIIGISIVGINLPGTGTYRVPIMTSLFTSLINYVFVLASVYILAMVIDYLAPTFSAEKNMEQAFKLSAYSGTAAWLSGIFILIPMLAILSVLGLYSVYLLYTGLPVLMKCPREKSMPYTVVIVIAAILIFFAISFIPRVFISYPTP